MAKAKRTLLLDADVFAYQAASACEQAVDHGEGYWSWHCDFDAVLQSFDANIQQVVEALGGTDFKLCLTDSENNFRKQVLSTYKSNRSNVKKPLVLKALKQFLIEERDAYFKAGLEGDDCLAVLATMKWPGSGERVIVSLDKDMASVPGLVCRWPIEKKPRLISEDEADYSHMFQTLTGDATDGYAGCPGVGKVGATKILAVKPKGPINPETTHVEWMWQLVCEAYEKAGLCEADALQQARVARILRASDYDFNKKEPILWCSPV